MANNVEKVNGIAIGDIEKVNGITDANLQAFNGEEFTGSYQVGGLSWSVGASETYRGGHTGTGTVEAFLLFGGYH
jgi:hypothetical protein